MYSHITLPSSLVKTEIFRHTGTSLGLKTAISKGVCVSRPLCTPSTGLRKGVISSPYQLCLLHILRPLTFITEAPSVSLVYMADETSHQAGSVCPGPTAALHEQTGKPAVTSLQPQGHRGRWECLMFMTVTRKAVPWGAMPGDSSL